jgi:hypothetical protein
MGMRTAAEEEEGDAKRDEKMRKTMPTRDKCKSQSLAQLILT